MSLFAKKSLGQNFLTDRNILKKIASLLEISPEDRIVEIGPGHGELTEEILALGPKALSVIEKDSDLWDGLIGKFSENKAFSLVKGDALELLEEIAPSEGDWKMAGNIPYYITGYLFRVMGEMKNPPTRAVFTVQKEVAERACAVPPDMNILAASVGYWARSEMGGVIKRGSFRPVPNEDSAVLVFHKKEVVGVPRERYYGTMRTVFKQPRKTVLNNLSEEMSKEKATEVLSSLGIDPRARPQNLSVDDIVRLSENL